uniref:Putative conserved secreted protein n=1 Tax=Culex tarsalis TaxID=7177 RepID=A0A1Q3F0L6_CULTA
MKVLHVGVIVTSICFQTISALWCMQGAIVDKHGDKSTSGNEVEKMPEVAECGAAVALASTALLFAVKPNTISFPSGDYKCYHLKYEDKNSDASTIIKGCIYSSLNVCDGKFTSKKTNEVFCSQCSEDGCNAAGRFGSNFQLLGLTMVLAYLFS